MWRLCLPLLTPFTALWAGKAQEAPGIGDGHLEGTRLGSAGVSLIHNLTVFFCIAKIRGSSFLLKLSLLKRSDG